MLQFQLINKINQYVLILITISISVSCQNDNEIKRYDEFGNLKVSYYKKEGVISGDYTFYSKTGCRTLVTKWENGVSNRFHFQAYNCEQAISPIVNVDYKFLTDSSEGTKVECFLDIDNDLPYPISFYLFCEKNEKASIHNTPPYNPNGDSCTMSLSTIKRTATLHFNYNVEEKGKVIPGMVVYEVDSINTLYLPYDIVVP